MKKNHRIFKYKIEYPDPSTMQKLSSCVSVEDITSAIAEKEKQRKVCGRDKMKKAGNRCLKVFFIVHSTAAGRQF